MINGTTRRAFLTSAVAVPSSISYRTLGKTGLKVTSVGFGCMVTSDASVIDRALDAGINYFDTARDYKGGNSERMLGDAVKGRRDKVYISTKTAALDKQEALEDLDLSLKSLGTDYIDIWMLHERSKGSEISPELVQVMLDAKKAGKIRFLGVSTHRGQADVIPAVIRNGSFDVVMVTYNFAMDMSKTLPPIKAAREANLGVIGMKALAGSFRLEAATYDKAKAVMQKPGAALAALKWSLAGDVLDCVLPSMTDADQLAENLKAMSEPLRDDDKQILAMYMERYGSIYCRMCGACSGSCAKGLPVSDIQRALAYVDGYRDFPLARERYLRLSQKVGPVVCDCASCSVRCVHGVSVAARVRRAQQLLS
jgi:predicted aldo/keto reductase-like oxidoreductase